MEPLAFNQSKFDIRCEWGLEGAAQLAGTSDVVIVVDVLSFSTCVEIATRRGAVVYPYYMQEDSPEVFAGSRNAELAERARSKSKYSLSPQSLLNIQEGIRLVLPSPNGAALTLRKGNAPTLTGCLRNYQAVASAAQEYGKRVAVIPAGERWPDGSLRPAFEDWVCAGGIISQLQGTLSPEARAARAAFRDAARDIEVLVNQCGSARELVSAGFEEDVRLACALNASECVPVLVDGAYQRRPSGNLGLVG